MECCRTPKHVPIFQMLSVLRYSYFEIVIVSSFWKYNHSLTQNISHNSQTFWNFKSYKLQNSSTPTRLKKVVLIAVGKEWWFTLLILEKCRYKSKHTLHLLSYTTDNCVFRHRVYPCLQPRWPKANVTKEILWTRCFYYSSDVSRDQNSQDQPYSVPWNFLHLR